MDLDVIVGGDRLGSRPTYVINVPMDVKTVCLTRK